MDPWSFNFALAENIGHPFIARHAQGYRFDFDGSERFYRPRLAVHVDPNPADYPNGAYFGTVQGFMPMMNAATYAQMVGRIPWGPTVDQVPTDPTRYVPNVIFPELPKVGFEGAAA